MSKKSRRARAKFRATQQAVQKGEISRPEPVKAAIEPKVIKPVREDSASVLVESAQYRYLLPEIRRIGIIAAILFVIIIVLSFIIS